MTSRTLNSPPKWRRITLISTVAVLGALIAFLATPRGPREPEYQGKPLSFWLNQAVISTRIPMQLRLPPEAEEAVRQIGTNAIPLLLARIRPVDSPLRRAAIKAMKVAPNFLARLISRVVFPSGYEPWRAMLGFKALGASAKPAFPQLIGMLDGPNEEWAVRALLFIGNDSIETLKESIGRISDENRRMNVVWQLQLLSQEMSPDAPDVSPVLIQRLKEDSSWRVRLQAVDGLKRLKLSAEIALGPLVRALNDPDPLVRAQAAQVIGQFGKDARSAMPALQQAINDKHPTVRANAMTALQQISSDE